MKWKAVVWMKIAEVHDDKENVQKFIYEAVLKLDELKGENSFSVKALKKFCDGEKVSTAIQTLIFSRSGQQHGRMSNHS